MKKLLLFVVVLSPIITLDCAFYSGNSLLPVSPLSLEVGAPYSPPLHHNCLIKSSPHCACGTTYTDRFFDRFCESGLFAAVNRKAINDGYSLVRGYNCELQRCSKTRCPEWQPYAIPDELLHPYFEEGMWRNIFLCVDHNGEINYCNYASTGREIKVIGALFCRSHKEFCNIKERMRDLLIKQYKKQNSTRFTCSSDEYPKQTPVVQLWYIEDSENLLNARGTTIAPKDWFTKRYEHKYPEKKDFECEKIREVPLAQLVKFLGLLSMLASDTKPRAHVEFNSFLKQEHASSRSKSVWKKTRPQHEKRPIKNPQKTRFN